MKKIFITGTEDPSVFCEYEIVDYIKRVSSVKDIAIADICIIVTGRPGVEMIAESMAMTYNFPYSIFNIDRGRAAAEHRGYKDLFRFLRPDEVLIFGGHNQKEYIKQVAKDHGIHVVYCVKGED